MSTTDRDYHEKRDFIRMSLNTEALIYLDGESQPIPGRCGDLSATGMSLLLDRPLAEGGSVRVVIPSPNEQFNSLDAKATVVRCEADDDGNYLMGLAIDQLR